MQFAQTKRMFLFCDFNSCFTHLSVTMPCSSTSTHSQQCLLINLLQAECFGLVECVFVGMTDVNACERGMTVAPVQ